MVKLTLVARLRDGLPLAEGLDTEGNSRELEPAKQQAKTMLRQLAGQSPAQVVPRQSFASGPVCFHYLVASGVVFVALCEKAYPKKLAYQYLDELQREFDTLFGTQVEGAARPYAFIKFDTFIQKTKRLYADTRTQRNLSKLNEDLADIQSVVTRNIQEVLGMGEKLDAVSAMSASLTAESRKYAGKSAALARQALIRKWTPVAIVALVVLLMLWWRFG